MELDKFIESQGIAQEDFDAQCQQYAQAKVKQDLIIQGIMDAEGMTFDDEESLAIQNDLVEQYGSGDLATLIDTYGQVAVDESIGLTRVEDFIVANATFEQASDDSTAEDAGAEDSTKTDSAADTETSADAANTADNTDSQTDNTDTAEDTEADASAEADTQD